MESYHKYKYKYNADPKRSDIVDRRGEMESEEYMNRKSRKQRLVYSSPSSPPQGIVRDSPQRQGEEKNVPVTLPSFLKAGLKVGILSSLMLVYSSSILTILSALPRLPFTVIGATSASNFPLLHAALARL